MKHYSKQKNSGELQDRAFHISHITSHVSQTFLLEVLFIVRRRSLVIFRGTRTICLHQIRLDNTRKNTHKGTTTTTTTTTTNNNNSNNNNRNERKDPAEPQGAFPKL